MTKFTTSMMCASPFELQSMFPVIEKHTDIYHIDIMDDNYVPNITLPFTYVKELRKHTKKPIDVHLMVNYPLNHIDELIEYGADCITIHPEAVVTRLYKCIKKIKDAGLKFGVALNPSVNLSVIKDYADLLDKITIMTVEPGFAGQKMIPSTLNKIKEAFEFRKEKGLDFLIEIDGNNNYETFPKYKENGADIYVLGSTIFKEPDLEKSFVKLKKFFGCYTNQYRVGVDIGGTFTRIGLVNENLEAVIVEKQSTKESLDDLIAVINDYIKKHNDYDIRGIGIGIPGIVDSKKGDIISVPSRNYFESKGFAARLEKETGISVKIDNDVNSLLRNDLRVLGLGNIKSAIGFYVGTGFGNAILLDGKVYYGDNSFASEIGHVPILNNNRKCGCGNIGCLETMVSGKSLRRIQEEFFEDTIIDDLFCEYKEGNELDKFIINLAKSIAMELNILDISNIVLGGGVMGMKYFPKDKLEEYIKRHLRCDIMREKLNIYYIKSKAEDGIVGSAIMFDL